MGRSIIKSNSGFTLVEILVTSVILGIVALVAADLMSNFFNSLNRAKMQAEIEDGFNLVRMSLLAPESCKQVVRMQASCFQLNPTSTNACGANCVGLSGSLPGSPVGTVRNATRLCDRNGNIIFAANPGVTTAFPFSTQYRVYPQSIQFRTMSPAMQESGGVRYVASVTINFRNHRDYGAIAPKTLYYHVKVPSAGANANRAAECFDYQNSASCSGIGGLQNNNSTGECRPSGVVPTDGACTNPSNGVATCAVASWFYAMRMNGGVLQLVRTCTLRCQYNP